MLCGLLRTTRCTEAITCASEDTVTATAGVVGRGARGGTAAAVAHHHLHATAVLGGFLVRLARG